MFSRFLSRLTLAALVVQMGMVSAVDAAAPSIVISLDSSSPTQLIVNGDDQSVLDFSITTDKEVTFKTFPISLAASETEEAQGLLNGTASNFTDIKIVNRDTGAVVFGPADARSLRTAPVSHYISEGSDELGYVLFSDDLTLDASSTTHYSLTVDVADNAALTDTAVHAALELNSRAPLMEDAFGRVLKNKLVLTPTSRIVSTTLMIDAPSLSMALASVPAAGSNLAAVGESDVTFVGVTLSCGDTSDCTITGAVFQGYLDDDGNASSFVTTPASTTHETDLHDYLTALYLVDDEGNMVASYKTVDSGFGLNFDELSWTLDAGNTQTLYLVGNISAGAFANGDSENIAFGLTSSLSLTVEDEEGNAVAVSGSPVNTSPTTYVTVSR